MAHEEALQTTTDSEEESSFSSEEEEDFEDELLHFEERFDAAEDTLSNEKMPLHAHHTRAAHKRLSVFNSEKLHECESDQMPAAKRARTLSWKAETDVDRVPQTLRFLPARELGPQLSAADAHSPMSLFKLFFTESTMTNLCHNTNAQAARAIAKGRKYKWTDVSVDELYRYIGLVFYMAAVKMSSITDYWRQDSLFFLPFPATVMPRDRYPHNFLEYSSNGYTVDFSVYTGKNSFPADRGLSYDAVMSLLDRKVLGSGYHVYMDDFYTSHKLFTDLFALKFGACGTYRDQRKDFFPKTAANSLSRSSSRGSIRWIRDGPLVCVKWMDTQVVSVCSTIHAAYTGERVQRKIKAQDTWKAKSFPCPAPVIAYNQHMGGVDLSGQLLQYYAAQHKTMKWYRKIFLHFLDIAASNAFILYNFSV
ncbi:piggyBac transposable element-derived protein 4-like [Cyprinus carpio]|uniref:PiggyBac transposable element-derived protein 4-like n=1 Tax=Cyprinus carpio TaxID=7962 RepID=A0A9Q9Y220_CYPCA|nr:piggyBac transposable element-derived protein 4-like [Cyprinus carpio]